MTKNILDSGRLNANKTYPLLSLRGGTKFRRRNPEQQITPLQVLLKFKTGLLRPAFCRARNDDYCVKEAYL